MLRHRTEWSTRRSDAERYQMLRIARIPLARLDNKGSSATKVLSTQKTYSLPLAPGSTWVSSGDMAAATWTRTLTWTWT